MNFMPYGWYYESLNSRSPAWTGVNEFWEFGVANRGWGLKLTPCGIEDVEIADVVQLFNGVRYYHTLIITSIEFINGEKTLYVSAHDNAAFDKPLLSYGFSGLRFAKTSD